jgi:hypothetical protein
LEPAAAGKCAAPNSLKPPWRHRAGKKGIAPKLESPACVCRGDAHPKQPSCSAKRRAAQLHREPDGSSGPSRHGRLASRRMACPLFPQGCTSSIQAVRPTRELWPSALGQCRPRARNKGLTMCQSPFEFQPKSCPAPVDSLHLTKN